MRIPCPYCGLRDSHEFTCLGDASVKRPDPAAPDALDAFSDYVYMRDNPAGAHRELFFHTAGCRSWVVVERDTRTHAIAGATLAREVKP
ncbi:sarcosine oxidase subunit delta [Xanthobacteraceae bacterium A53D]